MAQFLTDPFGQVLGHGPLTPWGQWLGPAFVELLDDGRHVRLMVDLRFQDARGVVHVAPAGFVSDGASIPQALWSLVGGPLSGRYRRAAILHDWTLRDGMAPGDSHALFRDAMRADGVSEEKAAQFHAAVSVKTLWDRVPWVRSAWRALRWVVRR
jgi:hypothetical protein